MAAESREFAATRAFNSARLLAGLEPDEADEAAAVLATCTTLELAKRALRPRVHFEDAELLILEQGFVVVRSVPTPRHRSLVTCEAAGGGILLPPSEQEVLEALRPSRLTLVDAGSRDRLLELPSFARVLLRELARSLRRKQDAISAFGSVRHADRVRRKLIQLAADYGRVTLEGIRLDIPLTHVLLAEMVGSERETITRAVDQLAAEEFLSRTGRTFVLHVEPAELATAATE
jgi:hypothetical protein